MKLTDEDRAAIDGLEEQWSHLHDGGVVTWEPAKYPESFYVLGLRAGMERAAKMCDEATDPRWGWYGDEIAKFIRAAINT